MKYVFTESFCILYHKHNMLLATYFQWCKFSLEIKNKVKYIFQVIYTYDVQVKFKKTNINELPDKST